MSACGTHAGHYAHRRAGEASCPACKRAYDRHRKAWRLERERSGPRIVPGDAVREHVARLREQGMSLRGVAAAAGVSASTLANIVNRPNAGANRRTAAAVLAVTGPHYAMRHPDDEHFVPRTGAERRIRALLAIGWTHRHMLDDSGVRTHLVLAQVGIWITVRNHRRIAEMYDRLSMTPGPSAITRRRAERLGYVPPLAWDDDSIDDLAAWADLGGDDEQVDDVVVERLLRGADWRVVSATRADRLAAADRWAEAAPGLQLEQHLGLRNPLRRTKRMTEEGAA